MAYLKNTQNHSTGKENKMVTKNNPNTASSKTARRVIRILVALSLALVALAGGFYLWALSATDTSLVARGIVWGDADADDWRRFPSRTIQAGPDVVEFQAADQDWTLELTIDNIPFETYLEQTETTAFIILRGDELLYEGYFNGSSRETRQASLSITKSFVSTLVGIALEEGLIGSLDDPITTYLPGLHEQDPRFAAITIRHLLTMSSGIRFDRDGSDPFSDDFVTYYSPDLRSLALESPILEEPGLQFRYNDYNPLLIGLLLEHVSGMSVSEYMETRLWQPMGAEGDATWDLDSEASGFEKMTVGINARAIDFARFGRLFLLDGRNGDRQLVPAAWVAEATRMDTTTDPAAYYQYFWWVDVERQAFYAEGNFCQMIYVYPRADLVIVRNGTDCAESYSFNLFGDLAQWIEANVER